MPSKNSTPPKICLKKDDGDVSFDPKANAETFKTFFANLANNLVEKLPIPTKKFGKENVKEYYKTLGLS